MSTERRGEGTAANVGEYLMADEGDVETREQAHEDWLDEEIQLGSSTVRRRDLFQMFDNEVRWRSQ